jgi:1-acyl-sn-glycerol-3-phosphate acyltransferase
VTLARRLVTIPTVLVLAAASVLLAPLWIPGLALADALRPARRGAALRAGAMLAAFLQCEAAGLLASLALWLASLGRGAGARERFLARNLALQRWWATTLFEAAQRIYGMSLAVEGEDAVAPGPMLLFPRHASVADTLLPALLVSAPHGMRLRYVLKRELLVDPCLDVVGNRLPNVFVRRGSEDSEREIAAVAALGRGLGRDEGVLLYPEGTRFTAAKRERILERLRAAGDAARVAHAERLRHLLPPRRGGPLALLDAAPAADVVFCAHTGLEGAASLADLWRGDLVGRLVRVRFWRIPRAEIPAERAARSRWLDEWWERLDAWVDAARAGPTS